MYFPSVAEGGDTYFIPLHEFYESLPKETRERYDKLWMVTDERRQAPIHPLVYQHPFRHETTMLYFTAVNLLYEDGIKKTKAEDSISRNSCPHFQFNKS